jgi:hypothetical protein
MLQNLGLHPTTAGDRSQLALTRSSWTNTLPWIKQEATVSRAFMAAKLQSHLFFPPHRMRHFLYAMNTDYQPHAPLNGLYLRISAALKFDDTVIFRAFVKIHKNIWQYLGQYEPKAAVPPSLTRYDWALRIMRLLAIPIDWLSTSIPLRFAEDGRLKYRKEGGAPESVLEYLDVDLRAWPRTNVS